MRAICANPASPLGENDFFRNQTGKLGKVLAFVRGDLLFVFNFNPVKSFEDYGVIVPPASDWKHAFDTDEPRFEGQGRIMPGMTYSPSLVLDRGELVQQIKLYLPARTAIVLKRTI